MMRWLVGFSLQFRFLVVIVGAVLVFLGISRLSEMPVDILPEFAPPYVEIQTEANGLSSTEVEALITVPLEEFLSSTAWVETMRSESVMGLSSILLFFEPGTDLIRARQLVQERLGMAALLPKVAKPPVMLQPLSATSRVMNIGLSSKSVSLIDMSVLARWTIRPRLMGVPGVANVAVWGQRARQLQVKVDPKNLQKHGVTLDQMIRTAGEALWVSPLSFLNSSMPGAGGWIETPNQRLEIRHVLPISSPQDLARVPVVNSAVTLGDVATVVEGHPPLIGDAMGKHGSGLLLVVEKFPWANTLEVTRGVDEALKTLQAGLPGVEIDTNTFRMAAHINQSLGELAKSLIIGVMLIVLILGAFFYYEWRAALISLTATLLSLVAAVLVLDLHGGSIDIMVLAGLVIALGIVVDDAIIDVENIVRRVRQHRKEGSQKSVANLILDASLEVRNAIIYATLIVVVAALPIFFMEGISGRFFQPLALAYAVAVLVSMVVALTVTPALSLILLSKTPRKRRESPLLNAISSIYGTVIQHITLAPKVMYVTVGVIVLIGATIFPLLGQSLLPSFKERDLLIHWTGAPGTSHQEMSRITSRVSRELQAIPGVKNFAAHMGRAIMGDKVVSMNSAELWVTIDKAADYDATVVAIRNVVDGYPGMSADVQTYVQEKVREVLTSARAPIVVRIFGPDLNILRSKAEEVRKVFSEIEGIVNPRVDLQIEEPHVEIKVDLEAAKRYNLKPGDIRRQATTLVAGVEVGNLFEEQKVFEVMVVGVQDIGHSLNSVSDILIETPVGGHVRLKDVAKIRILPTPNVIKREGVSRRIDVIADIRNRDLGSIADDIEERLEKVNFPLEYHPELLGEYAEREAAEESMMGMVVVAAVVIFLLIQAALGSWRLATLIFLTLPLTLVGGIFAVFLGGGVISLGSLVGFLTVFAIAARNGIILTAHYQYLERCEGETFGQVLVVRGSREKLIPVLMTALVTGFAILPLIFFGKAPGYEMVHPMAVVILGGIVTSTLLTLLVLPALYLRFGAATAPTIELAPVNATT